MNIAKLAINNERGKFFIVNFELLIFHFAMIFKRERYFETKSRCHRNGIGHPYRDRSRDSLEEHL
jgi:hypothetical protein